MAEIQAASITILPSMALAPRHLPLFGGGNWPTGYTLWMRLATEVLVVDEAFRGRVLALAPGGGEMAARVAEAQLRRTPMALWLAPRKLLATLLAVHNTFPMLWPADICALCMLYKPGAYYPKRKVPCNCGGCPPPEDGTHVCLSCAATAPRGKMEELLNMSYE
jgi:hypothetical protein